LYVHLMFLLSSHLLLTLSSLFFFNTTSTTEIYTLSLHDALPILIRNLKDTTIKNNEQDWLKTNLAKFTRMLQGQKDMLAVGKLILSELAPVVSAQHGVFYIMETPKDEATEEPEHNEPYLRLLAS